MKERVVLSCCGVLPSSPGRLCLSAGAVQLGKDCRDTKAIWAFSGDADGAEAVQLHVDVSTVPDKPAGVSSGLGEKPKCDLDTRWRQEG